MSSFGSINDFHNTADRTLEVLQDAFDELDETSEGIDCNLSDGVLTVTLGSAGTWVLNKQTPNRQLWWSSPLSGPKRFEYGGAGWQGTRDGEALEELLENEVSEAVGNDIDVDWEAIGP